MNRSPRRKRAFRNGREGFGPVSVETIEGIAAVIYFSVDTNGLSHWERIGLAVR